MKIGRCKGGPDIQYNKDCCTVHTPCGENEGDCDRDEDCADDLVCMPKSCGEGFRKNAECCATIGIVP